jgi:hypothetical protein
MRPTFLIFCFFVAACGQSGPPTRGVPVTFEAACDKANVGKRLMLEGYVDYPAHGYDDKAATVMLRLRPRLGGWSNTVGASAKLGHEANSVENPPEQYKDDYKNRDLRLHLNDGRVVGYANKVKVSGTMYYTSALGPGDYTCGLANTLYEIGSGFQPEPKWR